MDYCEITSNNFCFAQHSKKSACVTKNSQKAGGSSRYAGDREKGLKILRLPSNAGELTAIVRICAAVQGMVFRPSRLGQGV